MSAQSALIEQTEIVKILKDAIAAVELAATSLQKLLRTKGRDHEYVHMINTLTAKLRVEELYLARAEELAAQ
jgi:hypothetical protein